MIRTIAASALFASMVFPAAAKASTPADDAAASTPKVRVSTGIVAPKIVDTVGLVTPSFIPQNAIPVGSQVDLSLTVDANGNPTDIKVVKSLNPMWDANVVKTVKQFHFSPATLDNKPTPMDVNLTVTIGR